jgi:hypothetical protein
MRQCESTRTLQHISTVDRALENNMGETDSDEERGATWGEVVDGRRHVVARATNVLFGTDPAQLAPPVYCPKRED